MELIASLFSKKSQKSNDITLTEGSKIITDDEKCAYFNGAVKEMKIPINEDLLENFIDIEDPILSATENYHSHPSIFKIKEKTKMKNQFCVKHVNCKEAKRIIKDINTKKFTQKGDLPVIFFPIITNV